MKGNRDIFRLRPLNITPTAHRIIIADSAKSANEIYNLA